MTTLTTWALRWSVSPAAMEDLRRNVMGLSNGSRDRGAAGSEAGAQAEVRLEASELGMRLWRNNVGAGEVDGQFMRWGLANDSKQVNAVLKSGDLIGIRPVLVTPQHVGHTIGQFVSREVKAPGWRWSATPREIAQQNWAALVLAMGGDAAFCTGRGTL